MLRNSLFAAGVVFLSGCTALVGGGYKMTTGGPIDVKGLGDPLEESIEITSYQYSRPSFGGMTVVAMGSADPFFRSYIEKETGIVAHQLYVYSNNADWRYWDEAKFLMDGEVVNIPLSQVGSDVNCSQYGCSHYEHSVGDISKDQLEYIAEQPKETTIRLSSSQVNSNLDFGVTPAEAQAFLKKFNEVEANRN